MYATCPAHLILLDLIILIIFAELVLKLRRNHPENYLLYMGTSAIFMKPCLYDIRMLEVPVWNQLWWILSPVLLMYGKHKKCIA
jgi:hypothetical protein